MVATTVDQRKRRAVASIAEGVQRLKRGPHQRRGNEPRRRRYYRARTPAADVRGWPTVAVEAEGLERKCAGSSTKCRPLSQYLQTAQYRQFKTAGGRWERLRILNVIADRV